MEGEGRESEARLIDTLSSSVDMTTNVPRRTSNALDLMFVFLVSCEVGIKQRWYCCFGVRKDIFLKFRQRTRNQDELFG